MTPRQMEEKSAGLEKLRARWAAAILPQLRARVADARAHAQAGLPLGPGRDHGPRMGKRARIALERLDDLLDVLAGHRENGGGVIAQARRSFYERALEEHADILRGVDVGLMIEPFPRATEAELEGVAEAMIHGLTKHQELGPHFDDVKRELHSVVTRAFTLASAGQDPSRIFDAWEVKALDRLSRAIETALVDSVEYADTEAGNAVLHPDVRNDGPVTLE